MSTPEKSLAVIDATDAVVLAPEALSPVLSEQQQTALAECQSELARVGTEIDKRECDLIYQYIEAGLWLMRAREVHRVSHDGKDGETGRFLATDQPKENGFVRWLEGQEAKIPRNTAYRWMQGAANVGLTHESTVKDIWALKLRKSLNGQTLTALCRKPVDKSDKQAETEEVTDAEAEAERLADLREAYRLNAQFLAEQVIDQQTWAELSPAEITAYAEFLGDALHAVRAGLKKAKALPAPAPKTAKPAPVKVEEIPVDPPAPFDAGKIGEALAEAANEFFADEQDPDADPIYNQDEADRGLWWWGYRNPWGNFFAHTYRGDFNEVIEARKDPRIVVISPFRVEGGQKEAEKIVEQRCAGMKPQAELVAEEQAAPEPPPAKPAPRPPAKKRAVKI